MSVFAVEFEANRKYAKTGTDPAEVNLMSNAVDSITLNV